MRTISKVGRVCEILRRAKLPKDNLPNDQQKALTFKSLKQGLILPADEKNTIVLEKKEDSF